MATKIDIDGYVRGVLDGRRAFVARAITLVESTRAEHRVLAQELLNRLLPHAGAARRIGISGVPGVGKSTFIDALGTMLTGLGHRVAVLAVDPSSSRTGGSILGDKTRMERLAVDPAAFVRPSPTAGTLGGVAKATRESIVVMEAAGYDVVLVETVGVGQSETAVANMVDTFLLLTLARTGDQLQGIKKGVLELADAIAVNKADGPHERDARSAARELAGALRLMHPVDAAWTPPVLTCSARESTGLDTLWERLEQHRALLESTGRLAAKRRDQQVDWTWTMVRDDLLDSLHSHPAVRKLAPELEQRVREGTLTATLAAEEILGVFRGARPARAVRDRPAERVRVGTVARTWTEGPPDGGAPRRFRAPAAGAGAGASDAYGRCAHGRYDDGRPVGGRGEDFRLDAVELLDQCGVHGLAGRPRGDDPPVAHGDQEVGVPCGGGEVVEHHDDGAALRGDFADQVQDFHCVADVEGAGGLVEQDDRGLLGEGHGEPAALTLAAGELVEPTPGQRGRTGGLQGAGDRALVLLRPLAEQPLVRVASVPHESGDGDRLGCLRGLGQQGDAVGGVALAQLPDVGVADEHPAGAGLVESGHGAQEGRLAAPVGADDRHDLPGEDRQVDLVHGGMTGVSSGELFDTDFHEGLLSEGQGHHLARCR